MTPQIALMTSQLSGGPSPQGRLLAKAKPIPKNPNPGFGVKPVKVSKNGFQSMKINQFRYNRWCSGLFFVQN